MVWAWWLLAKLSYERGCGERVGKSEQPTHLTNQERGKEEGGKRALRVVLWVVGPPTATEDGQGRGSVPALFVPWACTVPLAVQSVGTQPSSNQPI